LLGWDFVPGSAVLHEIFPAMLLSTGIYVALAIMTQDTASEAVAALIAEAGRTSSKTS
jgi:hypothetical protein